MPPRLPPSKWSSIMSRVRSSWSIPSVSDIPDVPKVKSSISSHVHRTSSFPESNGSNGTNGSNPGLNEESFRAQAEALEAQYQSVSLPGLTAFEAAQFKEKERKIKEESEQGKEKNGQHNAVDNDPDRLDPMGKLRRQNIHARLIEVEGQSEESRATFAFLEHPPEVMSEIAKLSEEEFVNKYPGEELEWETTDADFDSWQGPNPFGYIDDPIERKKAMEEADKELEKNPDLFKDPNSLLAMYALFKGKNSAPEKASDAAVSTLTAASLPVVLNAKTNSIRSGNRISALNVSRFLSSPKFSSSFYESIPLPQSLRNSLKV